MKNTLYLFLCIYSVFGCPLNVQAQIISTYAGGDLSGFSGDGGTATNAKLYIPCSIITDATGNIYFTDQKNNCVRKIDTFDIITTVAGIGGVLNIGFSGDNGPATDALMSEPWGVARDASGNLYISDQGNTRVRKVNTSGIITTIAGQSDTGTSGNGGPATAAYFKGPLGITTDIFGNIYIGDASAFTIRKIDPAGIITLFAGSGLYGSSGDGGPATNARFKQICGLATDSAGNVYISDEFGNCIRKVNPSGIISTVAGNGIAGYGGDGHPATDCNLYNPTGVFIDNAGNMLITESQDGRIRSVNTSGIINTIAGTGVSGFGGDGGLCTSAQFSGPVTTTEDFKHNIFIADGYNNRIRKITMVLFFTAGHIVNPHYCQNISLISLDSLLSASDHAIGLTDIWSIVPGYGPYHGTAYVHDTVLASGANVLPSGAYYEPDFGFVGTDTIKVLITNGIATDTETLLITMDPFINNAGSIAGDTMVCVGTSILLSDSAAGGSWTVSNLDAVVMNGVVTGQSGGLDTVIYTVTNACGHASVSKAIIVHALPFTATITGIHEVCIGSTVVLTDTVTGGQWNITNGNATINPILTNCYVSGYLPGNDTVLYSVSDSFCTASASLNVTVIALPTAAINGGSPNLCAGAVQALTGVPSGGIWNLSNTNASFDSNATGGILTGAGVGNDTLTYSVTNYCTTAVAVFPFETDTLPAKPVITRIEGTLYAPPGAASYQWEINGLPVPGATADTFSPASEGDYSVLVANSFGCAINSDTVDFPGCGPEGVIVYPNPAESIVYVSWCKNVTLRLICMDGRVALTLHNSNEINLEGLANEDYLLAIYDDTGKKVAVKLITKLER